MAWQSASGSSVGLDSSAATDGERGGHAGLPGGIEGMQKNAGQKAERRPVPVAFQPGTVLVDEHHRDVLRVRDLEFGADAGFLRGS